MLCIEALAIVQESSSVYCQSSLGEILTQHMRTKLSLLKRYSPMIICVQSIYDVGNTNILQKNFEGEP